MHRNELPVRIDDLNLTAKEQKFVLEYVSNCFNGVAAAKVAKLVPDGMSEPRAKLFVHSLLTKKSIDDAIARISEHFISPYRSKFVNQTLRQLEIRANYDPLWYYYPDGSARPLDSIPMEYRWAIDKVEPKIFGKNADVREVVYTLADKNAARKELREMLSLSKDESNNDDGMRNKLSEIFEAVKLGKSLADKKKEEPEMLPAPDQHTVVRTPAEIREMLVHGSKKK
jgi:hypothetical protein